MNQKNTAIKEIQATAWGCSFGCRIGQSNSTPEKDHCSRFGQQQPETAEDELF